VSPVRCGPDLCTKFWRGRFSPTDFVAVRYRKTSRCRLVANPNCPFGEHNRRLDAFLYGTAGGAMGGYCGKGGGGGLCLHLLPLNIEEAPFFFFLFFFFSSWSRSFIHNSLLPPPSADVSPTHTTPFSSHSLTSVLPTPSRKTCQWLEDARLLVHLKVKTELNPTSIQPPLYYDEWSMLSLNPGRFTPGAHRVRAWGGGLQCPS
jgi:hypothetical protein